MPREGYGHRHQQERARLLAALRDGDPCPRCGGPMFRTDELDVGHVVDVADGGAHGPRRLEHAACNRSAGAAAGNRRRAGAPAPALLRVVGQGNGPEFTHDLLRFGPDVEPADWPQNWIVGCEP